MTKLMTTTLLAGTVLLGLANLAFARTPTPESRHVETRAGQFAGDPAPRRANPTECSIEGDYHGWPYCFGSDRSASESAY